MMQRRAFVAGMAAVIAAPSTGEVRQQGKVWRIGYFDGGSPKTNPAFIEAFRAAKVTLVELSRN